MNILKIGNFLILCFVCAYVLWRWGESTKTTQLAVHTGGNTGGNNIVEPTPTNVKLTTALGAATHSLFIVRNTNSFQKLYPIRTFV